MTQLDREEREILDAYHGGRLEKVELTPEDVARYREAARAVSRKDRRINIRISSVDLEALQVRALEEGIPYQTLIASVLHKFVTGRLVPEH